MITEAEVKRIADAAASEAVARILLRLDIDPNDNESISDFKKDLRHLRAWREASTIAKVTMIRTAVGVIVTGLLGILLLYFRPGS